MGSFLTCLVAITTFMFFYTKTVTIVEKQDVDIMSALIDNNIDDDFRFTANNGFFISAALTRYNSNTTLTEEPRYGELAIEYFGWGYDSEEIGSSGREIDYHYCSEEELGFI